MTTIGRRTFIKGAGGLALAGGMLPKLAAPAIAQAAWPNKPVRIIVPLAPGGAIDFVARQCAQMMSQTYKQQFYVENRTGAGGTLGMDVAMKSEPDGYTILITNDNAASAPHILKLSYDYTKTLVPIILIATQPQIFAAHPSLGVSLVAEYVAYAKKNPGLGFASSGVGSNQHVVGLWFAKEADIKLEHVPYRGAGQAVTDLLAGHVKSAFLGPTSMIPHWKAGKLKFLAQTSGQARADVAGRADHGGRRLQGPGAGGLVRRLRAGRHAAGTGQHAERGHREIDDRQDIAGELRQGLAGVGRRHAGKTRQAGQGGLGEIRAAGEGIEHQRDVTSAQRPAPVSIEPKKSF